MSTRTTSTDHDLLELLRRLDGHGYPAYKGLRGSYAFPRFAFHIDHVQGDPFAAPSRVHVVVPAEIAGIPASSYANESRAIGSASFLTEQFDEAARSVAKSGGAGLGSGKSGLIEIDTPGQAVIARTSVIVRDGQVEARFTVGLPANGRRINGRVAAKMLLDMVPAIVERALIAGERVGANREGVAGSAGSGVDTRALDRAADTNEDADALRASLEARGLVAFAANGAVLPRRSGIDDRPLDLGAVPFVSPPAFETTIELPNAGAVTGMGIPKGVTLIVGGGFNGKSTLLAALERAVYNHRPGDGRDRVATIGSAVKIRAEDGRSVASVDISPFISNLPGGRTTDSFSSENASGSTSQAANIMEALEAGAKLLLIDEDTAATNFMIRDARMQELIAKDSEPITPFVDRVRAVYEERGVSSILVAGGSGDYFEVADRVIAMHEYEPREVTEEAHAIAARMQTGRAREGSGPIGGAVPRVPDLASLDPRRGRRAESVRARGRRAIEFGHGTIDLALVSQIVERGQTRAIGTALALLARDGFGDHGGDIDHASLDLPAILDHIDTLLDSQGLDVLDSRRPGDLVRFRRFELAAALNRLRTLRVVCPP